MTSKPLSIKTMLLGLPSLDKMSVDALVLAPFEEDRPLRGAAGYCDWRLNGRLSRMLQEGKFECKPRDVLLMDTVGRIGSSFVLLFGQGRRLTMDLIAFKRRVRKILVDVRKAGFSSYAIELPGVDPGPLAAQQAVPEFLDAAATVFREGRVVLLSSYPRFAEVVAEAAAGDDRFSLVS